MNVISEFPLGERTYLVGKLNAMQQFHLARRLGPALIMAGVGIDMLRKGMKPDLDDVAAIAAPVLEVISKMDDKESEYIIFTALSAVMVREAGATAAAPMMTPDGRQLMFSDLELPDMLRIVGEVLKANFANFLKGLDGEKDSSAP